MTNNRVVTNSGEARPGAARQPVLTKDIVDLFLRRNKSTGEYALVTIDRNSDEVVLEIGAKENAIELANSILFHFADDTDFSTGQAKLESESEQ